MTNEAYKHLFESAISALAAIDRELGLPDDGCNATALTIAEIQRLKKLAAMPAREPLTSQQVWENHEIMSVNAMLMGDLMRIVRAVEAAHGITQKDAG